MQINKKLYTTLMITVLTLSMTLAILPSTVFGLVAITSVTPNTGAPGRTVVIVGTSTTVGGEVVLYWDQIHAWDGTSGELARTYATGTDYTIVVTIPEAKVGVHYLTIDDLSSDEAPATETFTITSGIAIDPAVGLPGDAIEVTGTGFNGSKTISMEYWNGTAWLALTTAPIAPQTSPLGTFTCTFTIPATLANADPNVRATDSTANTGSAELVVGPYIVVTPIKGLAASTLQVTGRGFTANMLVDLRWLIGTTYVTVVNDSPIDATGSFTVTFSVPLLPDATAPGTAYTIRAIDNAMSPIAADATFTLIQSAGITVTPGAGKVGSSVTVAGTWFTASKLLTVTFDDTDVAAVITGTDGSFTTSFNVPVAASIGAHTITATDANGVTVSKAFTVIVLSLSLQTRATEYAQGDVLSVSGSANEGLSYSINWNIKDPNGVLLATGVIAPGDWQMITPASYVLSYPTHTAQLPADATVGTWNFTATNAGTTAVISTNLFTVSAPATLDSVMDGIDEVKDQLDDMTDMISDIDGNVVTIKGDVTSVKNLVSALDISVLSADLDSIQMDVADLKATVTSVADDVATVDTTLGTLQGTITAVEGNTATIETAVGTLQADITDVKGNVDNMPAWIAVVLALVAAVAAIFAVITIRQKIAG